MNTIPVDVQQTLTKLGLKKILQFFKQVARGVYDEEMDNEIRQRNGVVTFASPLEVAEGLLDTADFLPDYTSPVIYSTITPAPSPTATPDTATFPNATIDSPPTATPVTAHAPTPTTTLALVPSTTATPTTTSTMYESLDETIESTMSESLDETIENVSVVAVVAVTKIPDYVEVEESIRFFAAQPPEMVSLTMVCGATNCGRAYDMYKRCTDQLLAVNIIRWVSAIMYAKHYDALSRKEQKVYRMAEVSHISVDQQYKIMLLGRRGLKVLSIFQFSGFGLLSKYSCDKLIKIREPAWEKELDLFQQGIPMLEKLRTCAFHPEWIAQIQSIGPQLGLTNTGELVSSLDEKVVSGERERRLVLYKRPCPFADASVKRLK
ncbi:uncharacterized protein EV154DRAFT_553040 [Mucor mucedo]|uniref:uncharacterized protein n=1 Tax=Mucor mucedo TaxID=29922 RepID=UPI00221EF100|nr:uncharacterized protein EV154DRAFT_553040 [Mucor mucedo]KAI7889395.1 hypothetical protein EV154DRAFT_553040 [Mucor mucedo]